MAKSQSEEHSIDGRHELNRTPTLDANELNETPILDAKGAGHSDAKEPFIKNIKKTPTFAKTPLLLAMLIIATGQVGVSIYLPSLPLVAAHFSIGQVDVQSLVTLFLVGFGVSQLFYGPLSDSIGRRPVFILGQGVYLLGTLVCLVSQENYALLEVGRLLQGLGAGSASVLGRSVLRDSYDGPQLTKALSYISITASIMPIFAPVIGGWIAFQVNWQAVFVFVLIYLAAIFVLGWRVLPETLPYGKRPFRVMEMLRTYRSLITSKQVLASASFNWVSYLTSLVSLSLLPFLMQSQLGMHAGEYGSLMIIPSLGLLLGGITLNIANRFYSVWAIMATSITLTLASAAWLIMTPFTSFSLVAGFTLLCYAQGMSFPLAISMLLSPHKKTAGAVSALSGSVQMCSAGLLGSYIVEHFVQSQVQLGGMYFVTAMIMGTAIIVSRTIEGKES